MNINRIRSVIMEEVEKDIREHEYNGGKNFLSIKDIQEYREDISEEVDLFLKELKEWELK